MNPKELQRRLELVPFDLLLKMVGFSRETPLKTAANQELRRRVRKALQTMDGEEKTVILLRRVVGLSNEETARELGLDPLEASRKWGKALLSLRYFLIRERDE